VIERVVLDMPQMNREVKNMCNTCMHYDVCYARLSEDEGKLLYLTRCDFYREGGEG
jgi:hypothetical protein